MYVQITTRCNMVCAHCCYSCKAVGVDMSEEIFILACKLAQKLNMHIDLGGGEPTVHPLFWNFVGIALQYQSDNYICVATNGKRAEDALMLAKLADKRILKAVLSLDKYHEPIDYDVVSEFESKAILKYKGIRDITRGDSIDPAPFGRAKEWANPKDSRCPANDLFITPDGILWACGCKTKQYGSVYKRQLPGKIPNEWCPEKLGF